MATAPVSYPFDPTGQAQTNRIIGEQLLILSPGDRLFHFTMPKFAPFFEEGLVVKYKDTTNAVVTLIKGVDYYLSHKFLDASMATMHPIWGSITFLRRDIVGTIVVDYNTLGGAWVIDDQKIAEILLETNRNPRVTSWEQVTERPCDFPVIDHPWNLDDLVGQKEIVDVLERFYQAYLVSLDPGGAGAGGGSLLASHLGDFGNPHRVTAAQVGSYNKGEIDFLLSALLGKYDTAVNTTLFDGFNRGEILRQVKDVKVKDSEKADLAASATMAHDSQRLEGYTLNDLVSFLSFSAGGNATHFEGRTFDQAKAEILTGKAGDSGRLEGMTLSDVLGLSAAQDNDNALKFDGKTYQEAKEDILLGEAGDSRKFDGKTWQEAIDVIIATKVDDAMHADKASDSDLVYGMDLPALTDTVLAGIVGTDRLSYTFKGYESPINVNSPADGGTADPDFFYVYLGEYLIPETEPAPITGVVYYDDNRLLAPSLAIVDIYTSEGFVSSSVGLLADADGQAAKLSYFSNQDLEAEGVAFGFSVDDTGLNNQLNTKTAKKISLFVKIDKTITTRFFGVHQRNKNDLILVNNSDFEITDHTDVRLNSVDWVEQSGLTSSAVAYMQNQIDGLEVALHSLVDSMAATITANISTPL